MGSYDNRESPPYHPAPMEWAQNPHILAWWTNAHDLAIAQAIEAWQWEWALSLDTVHLAPEVVLARWREQDPLCRRYAWYNVLMGFAEARARVLNLTARIRKPERKACGLCRLPFMEDSLPFRVAVRLGMDRLDVCAPCFRDTVLFRGHGEARQNDIILYIRSIAELAGRVPPQGFGEHQDDLVHIDGETRLKMFALSIRPVNPYGR